MLCSGPFYMKSSAWFTKEQVLDMFRKWSPNCLSVKVCKILWDGKSAWSMDDIVPREVTVFDMWNLKDLDELVGYLFHASINGYTIRYASTDPLTGIFLERSRDSSTNIDVDVVEAFQKTIGRQFQP